MSLVPGAHLGHYTIVSRRGAGGTGAVWLAEDTTLKRKVALKILPAIAAADPDRLARFDREAKAVAALSHPNIVTIHSIEHDGDVRFLAMELVDGRTLSDAIPRGGLPVVQVLEIGTALADALAASHEHGIIHRDLKPANVMLAGRERRVKVLDFGLAKLRDESHADGQTLSAAQTVAGQILGTVAYMSPEQAEGRTVDARSDLFSLGIVLYEMATGERPFKGPSNASVLSAILKDKPASITELRGDLPTELARIIRLCLAKDPEERFQTAKDVRNQLRALQADLDSGQLGQPAKAGEPVSSRPRPGRSLRRWQWAAAGLLVVVGLTYAAYSVFSSKPGRQSATPFQSATVRKLTTNGQVLWAAISPDAKLVAYVESIPEGTRIVVRQIATAIDRVVWEQKSKAVSGLTFSTGGDFLYFSTRDRVPGSRRVLCKLSVLGGEPQVVMDDVFGKVTFSADGSRLAFVRTNGSESSLLSARVDGSDQRVLLTRRSPERIETQGPAWSADGRTIIVDLWDADGMSDLAAVAVRDGVVTPLTSVRWLNFFQAASIPDGSGTVVIGTAPSSPVDQIYFVPAGGGPPQRVTNDASSYTGVSVSGNGAALVTIQRDQQAAIWVAPKGEPRAAVAVTSGKIEGASGLSWTPDGRIVYGTTSFELWMMNADGSHQRRLIGDTLGLSYFPSVSPDGRYVFFDHAPPSHEGLWRMNIDGGGATKLATAPEPTVPRCSPDGKFVFYHLTGDPTSQTWMMSPDGSTKRPWLGKIDDNFAVSPDGKRVAGFYTDPVNSRRVLTITPMNGGKPDKEFSLPAGAWGSILATVRWTPDGLGVAYVVGTDRAANIWVQPIDGGAPRALTEFKDGGGIWGFDWSRDGRFAMARGPVNRDVVMMSREQR